MTAPDHFIVSTHLEWVWRDLRDGVAGRFPVTRDRGWDVPEVPDGNVGWWVATAHAARLRQAGLDLPLASVGPGWLGRLGEPLTGRSIHTVSLGDLTAARVAGPGFLKPAEAKVEQLPAQWYDDVSAVARDAIDAGVHPACIVQLTRERLDLHAEYRCFMLHGRPVAVTAYRDAAGTPWDEGYDQRTDLPHDLAHAFADEVARELAGNTPSSYVLDIAQLASGRWVVLEANAAWSSGTYGADLRRVVDCAVAASTGDPGRFAWQPDPHEWARAEANPLRRV